MIDKRLLNWSDSLPDKFIEIDFDIDVPRCRTKDEEIYVQNILIRHGAIPIHELTAGKTYIGTCRNASEAVWNGEQFVYQRYKWGETYPEEINHFQNDDGYDVFVPIKLKDE